MCFMYAENRLIHLWIMDFKSTLFSQLQTLIRSGLSFSRAFELIIEGAKAKEKAMYVRIFDEVVSGKELWRSLETETVFTELDRNVVRIGEETGRLVESLEFLTEYYRKREEQKRMVTSALSYPIITLSVAVIVLVFMLLVVVPMFEQVYARMGGELPAVTRQIIRMSESAPAVLGIIFLLGLSLYGLRRIYGTSDRYQSISSGIIMKLPLVSGLVRKYQVSRFCRIMHLLVSSDVPILHSLYLMQGIIAFYPYRKSIVEICRMIEKGRTLTDGMGQYETLYGKRFLVLLKVGEETNSLEQMLLTQANDTNAELEHQIKQLNNIIEPFLILVIGIIVAFVLIAMYMPMFKLGMTIQ